MWGMYFFLNFASCEQLRWINVGVKQENLSSNGIAQWFWRADRSQMLAMKRNRGKMKTIEHWILFRLDIALKLKISWADLETVAELDQAFRLSKNVVYRVSEKYQKYQINNEPNYNTCNRMFDMCSSYCENFIYISLSIALWHGIFENWRKTKMPFQRKRSIP